MGHSTGKALRTSFRALSIEGRGSRIFLEGLRNTTVTNGFSLPPPDLESHIVCNYSSLTQVLEQLPSSTASICKKRQRKCKGHFMHL